MSKVFSITFSGRFHYTKGGGVPIHRHDDDYQIQLIYGGSAKVRVNDVLYFVKNGDIIFLKKGDVHEFKVVSDEGMKTLEVKFSNPGEEEMEFIDRISVLFSDQNNQIYSLFSQIVQEGYRKYPGYKKMSTTLMGESLIHMARFCMEDSYDIVSEKMNTNKPKSSVIQCVTDYIYRNIDRHFLLKEMADECGYNQDYIYRTISNELGMSAVQYVNSIRFEEAKKLIQYTELSISEICWNLGFESLQYFSRFFSQRAKMSPSVYMDTYRNKVRTDY